MPNSQELSNIISEESKRSIVDANKLLQETIVLRNKLNDTIAGAKTMGDVNKNAKIEQEAQEKSLKLIAQRQLAEERLAAFQAKQQAVKDAAEAKELAKDQGKIDRIKRIEQAEANRLAQENARTQQELANSSQVTGAQANEAAAISSTSRVRQQATRVTQLSALAVEQERQNNVASATALRLQAREMNAAKGSLEQRRLALDRLRRTYAALNEQERASASGQRLATVIPQLSTQVAQLEGRSVGFGNAFTRAAGNAFGALRKIAYILPGVGLAGLIGFAVDPIVKYISSLDIFKKKLSEAKIEHENLNKTLEGGEYAKAVKNVDELRINIDLAKKGFIDKDIVVKQYNETIGETTGKVKSLNQAETELNKNADAYIQFTLLKAAAQLSLANAAQESVKAAQQAQEDEDRLVRQQTDYVIKGDKEGEGARKALTKTLKAEIKQREKDAEEAQIKQLSIAKKFQQEAAELAKKYGFTGLIDVKKDPKDKKANEKDARDSAAALVKIEIDYSKQIQDIYQKQADNVNFSIETRLDAVKNSAQEQRRIVQLEAEKDLVGKKNTAQEEELIRTTLVFNLEKIDKDAAEKAIAITKDTLTTRQQIILEQNQKDATALEAQRDTEIANLTERYNKGEISENTFARKRLEIEQKYTLEFIRLQIEQTDAFIKAAKLRGEDVGDAEAKLATLRMKYQDAVTANNKKNSDDIIEQGEKDAAITLEREKQNAEALKEVAKEVYDFSRGLVSGIFDQNIANLEAEKEARQSNTDLQVENVEESVASEQDKKDRIAVIQAQAAQDQLAIDAKIAQEKRKQAIADKLFAISQITINTAVAVSKALAQTGVLGAFVIPGIIALGAIQVASVLAQPIPKFKGGKSAGNNYEGMAWVGDGYEHELVVNKDGSSWLTPDKPTLTWVGKDTQVISGPELSRMQMMAKPDKTDVAGKSWDIQGLRDEIRNGAKQQVNAIKRLKSSNTVITKQGWFNTQTSMDKFNQRHKNTFGH